MPGLEFRYVGQDRLPARLSEFDVERYFALTDSDIAAINERFRRDRFAAVAIQLIFLRASGRTLDHVGTLPRQLLRHIGERLGLPTPTIASLRTLYQRYKTLYEHQVWICEYLGLTSIGPSHWAGLEAWMRQDAIGSLEGTSGRRGRHARQRTALGCEHASRNDLLHGVGEHFCIGPVFASTTNTVLAAELACRRC